VLSALTRPWHIKFSCLCDTYRKNRNPPLPGRARGLQKEKKTYNTGDSLVVTDPTTSPAVAGLSMGEQTGSRAFQCLWSYVLDVATMGA
jgi:hypothetical protein